MTPAELAKKDEFYSIYWSEYNLVKESGSPELMIRFIIETIMPIYRKEQVNGFTM